MPKPPQLDLDAFIAHMRGEIDRFAADWRKNMAENPDDWPAENTASEWYEQFLVYNEMA